MNDRKCIPSELAARTGDALLQGTSAAPDAGELQQQYRKTVKHFDESWDAHFLTFSCYQRLPLLSKRRTRIWLVQAVEKARQKHNFDLWAWVIMPEHVHLLIWPNDPENKTETSLAAIKQPVGTKAIAHLKEHESPFLERLTVVNRNRTYHRFWQAGPGYDRNLDEPKEIHEAIDYIHQNPVKRGLVDKAEDWIWSSARDWAGLEPKFLKVDRTVPTLHPG